MIASQARQRTDRSHYAAMLGLHPLPKENSVCQIRCWNDNKIVKGKTDIGTIKPIDGNNVLCKKIFYAAYVNLTAYSKGN